MTNLPTGSTPLTQSCWVVPDLDAAMASWNAMGVGPFFHFTLDVAEATHRGKPARLYARVACAYAGPMQIELIEPLGDGPSVYRDVVPAGGSGFHHVCRAYGGYDEAIASLTAQGCEIAMSGTMGPIRFAYVDTRALIGCMYELVDESDMATKMYAHMRAESERWDGSDGARPIDFADYM